MCLVLPIDIWVTNRSMPHLHWVSNMSHDDLADGRYADTLRLRLGCERQKTSLSGAVQGMWTSGYLRQITHRTVRTQDFPDFWGLENYGQSFPFLTFNESFPVAT